MASASALLSCTAAPRVITVIDANNVRSHVAHRRLDKFCEVVWRWWQSLDADGGGGSTAPVLLCIDHGIREESVCVAEGFGVKFAGSRCDADTDIVIAVDELLERHPEALLRIVTNDRQLRCRCRRVLPNLPSGADDDWYHRQGIEKPSARYAREWARGAARDAEQLDRISLVPCASFAAELGPAAAATTATTARATMAAAAAPTIVGARFVPFSAAVSWLTALVWMVWCWISRTTLLLGAGGEAAAARAGVARDLAPSASPFAMGAEAVARRAAQEERGGRKRNKHKRKPAQEAEWRQLEASELIISPQHRVR